MTVDSSNSSNEHLGSQWSPRVPQLRAQPTAPAPEDVSRNRSRKECLLFRPKQFFNRLHDRRLTIAKTIVSQLFRVRHESLGVERRIPALAVVIAAQPDRDVLRICNFVAGVLLACNLCDIDC